MARISSGAAIVARTVGLVATHAASAVVARRKTAAVATHQRLLR
jgi:hypothetical protein